MAVTRINIGNITVGDDTIRIGAVTTRNTNRATNASTPLLKGEKGDKGDKGDQGEQGIQGVAGQNATIAIGSTQTGQPGTQAVVTNVGTETNAILDFVIPKGEKGDRGTTDYEELINRPEINEVELTGNKNLEDLNVTSLTNMEIENLINSIV